MIDDSRVALAGHQREFAGVRNIAQRRVFGDRSNKNEVFSVCLIPCDKQTALEHKGRVIPVKESRELIYAVEFSGAGVVIDVARRQGVLHRHGRSVTQPMF